MGTTRKDGLQQYSFTVDGKRYYVYGKSSKELVEKVHEKRKEIEQKLETRYNPTVEEYYNKRIEYRQDGLAPNTVRNLNRAKNAVCNIYIESASRRFGEIKVKKVTTDDLRIVQTELAKKNKTGTVNNHMAKLKHVMCDAAKERLIVYNPFDLISNLKQTEEKARETYHRALSIEEQTKFFNSEVLKNCRHYNVLCMAILTGMRIGEIGALKYKDIKDGYIMVQRTLTRVNGDRYGIGTDAKTASGRRKIPITDQIREVIDRQKAFNELRKGNNIIDMEELLFVGAKGGMVLDQYVNTDIKKVCEAEGIELFTVHALRDTFATRAIESGMKPKTLQEIMGHKDFAITMNLYCHVLDDTKIKEMNLIRISI